MPVPKAALFGPVPFHCSRRSGLCRCLSRRGPDLPVPFAIRLAEPEITPSKLVIAVLLTVRVPLAPFRATLPLKSSGLLPPKVTLLLLKVTALEIRTPPVPAWSVPESRNRGPAPRAVLEPRFRVAPARVVVPVNVLVPPSVRCPNRPASNCCSSGLWPR